MAAYADLLSNHNLNTHSLKELAEDISKRLNVNIEYGVYPDFHNIEVCGGQIFCIEGRCDVAEAKETYRLIIKNYLYRFHAVYVMEYLIKSGEWDMGDDFKNEYWLRKMEDVKSSCISWQLLRLDKEESYWDKFIDIYPGAIEIEPSIVWHWNSLCEYFESNIYFYHNGKSFCEHRAENIKDIQAFGGTEYFFYFL